MRVPALVLLSALAACGTPVDPAQERAWQAEVARELPTCRTPTECDVKWSAARQYILANSAFRIQHLTPDFIETYPSPSGIEALAWRVQKTPRPDGSHAIEGHVSCGAPYSCTPPAWLALRDFGRFVNAAWAPPGR